MIWKIKPTKEFFDSAGSNTLSGLLDIQLEEVGDDFLKTSMPVDARTKQPFGLLHGGASVVLSETNGSFASYLCTEDALKKKIVGIEVNANHLKSASTGRVYGITKPIKLGKTLHVWQTEIYNEENELICISRLSVMIVG